MVLLLFYFTISFCLSLSFTFYSVKASVKDINTSTNDTLISIGTAVTLYCDYTGPNVKWYYNSLLYTTNVNNPTNGRSELTLSNFQLSNTGTYQCIASDNYQTMISSITLSAKGEQFILFLIYCIPK